MHPIIGGKHVRLLSTLALACFLSVGLCVQSAHAQGMAASFNWVHDWGTFDLSGNNDPVIPATNHAIKADIKRFVKNCVAASGALANIHTYNINYGGDSNNAIVVDASDYFGGVNQPGSCPLQPFCNSDGCPVVIYNSLGITNFVTAAPPKAKVCPSPTHNDANCYGYCPTDISIRTQCPGNFSYPYYVKWQGRAYDWTFITPGAFYGEIISPTFYRTPNANPILRLHDNISRCAMEEMDRNGSSVVEPDEPCIKYMQYQGGQFIDLYHSKEKQPDTTSDNRYSVQNIPLNIKQFYTSPDTLPSTQKVGDNGRGEPMGDGHGLKLAAHSAIALQIANYQPDPTKTAKFECFEFANTSDIDYFLPSNSDPEIDSFDKAARSGSIAGVSSHPCTMKYSPWVGNLSCSEVTVNCNETLTIAAERKCRRSTTSEVPKEDCTAPPSDADSGNPASAEDRPSPPGFKTELFFQATCAGETCPQPFDPGISGGGSDSSGGGGCSSGGGDCCFASTVPVLMADGTTKEISKIVVGDKVMGFNSKKPKAALKAHKVKAVMITQNVIPMMINDLELTPMHKVALFDGRMVPAKDLKKGDILIKDDGTMIIVNQIKPATEAQTVYNFDVENADGYVARGVRVKDYPPLQYSKNNKKKK
jgi:hypothetical protein